MDNAKMRKWHENVYDDSCVIELDIKNKTQQHIPVQMRQTQQEAILHGVEDASLVAYIAEGKFLPRVLEHRDKLGCGARQPTNLFQALLTL